ncbi:MAG: hypothetical protein ABMA64_31465 [Myxococcota bacterium]
MRSLLLVAVVAGCSSGRSASTGPASYPGSDTDTTAPTSDTSDTGVDPTPPAAYYHFELAFELSNEGEWVGPAAIEVEILAPDASSTCTFPVDVLSATAVPAPADEPAIFGWWVVDLAPADKIDGCPEWDGRRWWVGVGAYDTRLDPALAAAGLAGREVYGLYLSEDPSDRVFVLGYAATAEMIAGTDTPVDAPPLPAAEYVSRSLISMTAP